MSEPTADRQDQGVREEGMPPQPRMRGSTVLRLGAYIILTVGFFGFVRAAVNPGTGGPRPEETSELGRLADPRQTYDPVRGGGERPPFGFRQVLRRDDILPIYDPEFVAAEQSDWDDSTMVIGLELDGEAKAYPVRFLNRREMVLDSLAGIPVLVTW